MTLGYGFNDSDEAAYEAELYDSDFESLVHK